MGLSNWRIKIELLWIFFSRLFALRFFPCLTLFWVIFKFLFDLDSASGNQENSSSLSPASVSNSLVLLQLPKFPREYPTIRSRPIYFHLFFCGLCAREIKKRRSSVRRWAEGNFNFTYQIHFPFLEFYERNKILMMRDDKHEMEKHIESLLLWTPTLMAWQLFVLITNLIA